jgi:uncharacterized protein YggE
MWMQKGPHSNKTQENVPMKSTSNFLSLAVIAVLAVLAVFALSAYHPEPPFAAQAQAPADTSCDTKRSIQVSGAAVVNVIPDRAMIQLGVQSNGSTPDATQAANVAEIQRVIAAVRAVGVDAKDIATDYYIVYPVYDDYNSLVIKGYRINNTVSITLRDVNLTDDVILAALKAGANEVQDVQFYTSELRKFRDQARAMAMQAAREKAAALAETAGASTGCLISVNENSSYQYYGSWRGGRATAIWAQNAIQNAVSPQGDPFLGEDSPITLGQIAIRAEVSASYSLQ